jgi:hypothetical protein
MQAGGGCRMAEETIESLKRKIEQMERELDEMVRTLDPADDRYILAQEELDGLWLRYYKMLADRARSSRS